MNRRSARRPAFVAIVVAFTVAVGGVALANDYEPVRPPPPNPGFGAPVAMVCRDTNLTTQRPGLIGSCTTGIDNLQNGETVQVTVGGLVTNRTGGELRQCTLDLTLCEATSVPFTTGTNAFTNPVGEPDNAADPQITPTPFVVKSTFVAANGQTVNCLVTACVIYATLNTPTQSFAACHGLTFAGGVASACTQVPTPVTTTTTSTTSTVPPTTSSSTSTSTTSSSTTSTTSTSTTSTSTTVPPTTTSSTSSSTSTTVGPTTTSSSTTVAPTTSTSTSTTVGPGTTSTTTLSQCAQLQAARAQFNAQIDATIAAVNASTLTAAQKAAVVARLEEVRAQGNAQIDEALAACVSPA